MARGHSAGHVDQPRRRPRGPHARTIPHPGRRPPRRSGTASDRGRLTGTRRGAGGVNDVGWGDERPAAYCPSRFTLSLAARRPTVLLIHQDKLPSNEGFAMKIANQVFCLLAVGLLPGLAWAEQAKPSEPPENPPPIRIVVVGDSTVASYGRKADGRLPIAGWGQLLGEAFCDAVSVSNHAAGGRSSSSFVWEGRWAKAIAEKPDYVLIQFGHNDCPGKGIRYNDPATTYRDYLRRYVRYSRAAGAKPVLVTPMARRTFDDRGKITTSLAPYAEAMRAVAEEEECPVIDLHAASVELFNRLGDEGSADLSNKPGDRTHFSEKGARTLVGLIMEQLTEVEPTLRGYVKNGVDGD
ncbi:MAG TPA: hypothetical protein DD670_13760 [Planctomycetaceae bacterium]|nr:hypothetical protein [Planctomycetaceae bacterium]